MRTTLSALVLILIASFPSFAFGLGDCPHSKKGGAEESPREKVEKKAESNKE